MKIEDLNVYYDELQNVYGAKELSSIYNGGYTNGPDICFVFMNPTGRNPASSKEWGGIKAPWIGSKNIWDLFYQLDLLDKDIYFQIKKMSVNEWTEDFAASLYQDVEKHKIFITNLGKCTQVDARPLPDSVYEKYLHLLEREIEIINPKIVILFGNQVSSIVLNKKISVSKVRKEEFVKTIGNSSYKCYSVYYPVGNGRFNIDKTIEDIKWIISKIK